MCILFTGMVLPRLWRLTPTPIGTEFFRVMTEFGDVCASSVTFHMVASRASVVQPPSAFLKVCVCERMCAEGRGGCWVSRSICFALFPCHRVSQ